MLPTLLLAARLVVPEPYEGLMAEHLRRIEGAGWARVVPGDLYHAHLILTPAIRTHVALSSPNELFAHTVAVLYHSDEQLFRWRLEDGDLSTERKRPRSILGYPDGSIAPAASLFTDPVRDAPDYLWYGTIHPADLTRVSPERFLERRDWNVGGCIVNLTVDIFRRQGDGKLQLTMECARP